MKIILKFVEIVFLVYFGFVVGRIWGLIERDVKLQTFNGQQLEDAVNAHRSSIGLQLLKESPELCNDIAQRYIDVTSHPETAHYGFVEWRNTYVPKWKTVGEIISEGSTPEKLISSWVGSPSHREILDLSTAQYFCAYANNGVGIVEIGTP